jgi:hypothetical protein
MFGLNITPYTNPSGQIKLTNESDSNYHMPFRKKDVHWFNKHHKSFDRQVGQGADQLKDHNVKYNTSVIAMMNNLGSFNPTQKNIIYYDEHETNKQLQHNKHLSKDMVVNMKNTRVIDDIESMKKIDDFKHTHAKHSSTLKVRRL